MAIHNDIPSIIKESLEEMILVAEYCLKFKKDKALWSSEGCYGYPTALLLLSIADSIGSYVEGGNIENHFKILNNKKYYGLNLDAKDLEVIYKKYRNLLSHNTALAMEHFLDIGKPEDSVLSKKEGRYTLMLTPFYNASKKAVKVFLDNPDILKNNKMIETINKK